MFTNFEKRYLKIAIIAIPIIAIISILLNIVLVTQLLKLSKPVEADTATDKVVVDTSPTPVLPIPPKEDTSTIVAVPTIDPKGKALYEKSCFACHDFGIAGSPVKGKPDTWTKYQPLNIDTLTRNAIEGIGAMPPRGGTQASDADIRSAVEYLVSTVK